MAHSITDTLRITEEKLNAYSAGLLQGKAYRTLNAHLAKALFPFDLSIPEWKLLGQLYDHGNFRLADLAERLNVEPPLVTTLIDSLEKKKLVTRTQDETDKRVKVIALTAKGKKQINIVEPAVKKKIAYLLKGISKTELLTYVKVLKTIVDNGMA